MKKGVDKLKLKRYNTIRKKQKTNQTKRKEEKKMTIKEMIEKVEAKWGKESIATETFKNIAEAAKIIETIDIEAVYKKAMEEG